ncbi:MAG: hypothetical protein FD189_1115 [Elusimicrobia bacterium]|nr:MAG: hypothetical protein FD189_1115 [Elusimicrobiota bacterium]
MALTELMSARRQTNTGSRVTVIRRWKAPTSQVIQGAGGWVGSGITLPAKGDALPYGTFTNMVTPRCFDVKVDPKYRRKTVLVTAYYGAPMCQGAASTTRVEWADSQISSVDYRGRWTGLRRWECPDADAVTHRTALLAASWTVNGIAMRPRSVRIDPDMACPGYSTLTCEYHFDANPWHFRTGAATLGIVSNGVPFRMLHDVSTPPRVIEGPSDVAAEAADRIFYRIKEGSNIILKERAFLTVKTGYAPANLAWTTWLGWSGKTNSGALSLANFPTIAIGKLKCLSVEVPSYAFLDPDSQVVPVIFRFEWRKDGWPTLTCQKVKREAILQRVLSPNDDPASVTRTYIKNDGSDTTTASEAKWRIVYEVRLVKQDADAGARVLHDTADFSSVYTLLAW